MGNQIETQNELFFQYRPMLKVGATKEKARKVYTTFGVGRVVLEFLHQWEKIKGQLLNKFMYNIGISRAQTRIFLEDYFIFGTQNL